MHDAEGNSATILVIDDDPTVVKLIEKTFNDIGYNVLSALDTKNGLEIAKKQKPDLIILDVMMPVIDGFSTLKQLKDDESTKDICVIMLTVKRLDEDIQRGLDLGAEDYVSKPLHPGLLVKRVENVLKKFLEE